MQSVGGQWPGGWGAILRAAARFLGVILGEKVRLICVLFGALVCVSAAAIL